jgi:hypothetical protein
VQPDDAVEEDPGHRCHYVWMAQWQEMSVLGESVDDGEDDIFAVDSRESFNEIRGNVSPDSRWQVQRLEQPGQV